MVNHPTTEVGFAPGDQLGSYRILRRIGAGGSATVYEAVHRRLNKRVALKTLHDALLSNPEVAQRFLYEGIAASKLRHPHVVDITDVGEVGDIPFLVMELLSGETLGEYLAREGPLTPERIAALVLPIVAALQRAHELGIVHRDIKPANVFLTQPVKGQLHPKLLDFGVSKLLGMTPAASLTQSQSFLGTPSYAAPEQVEDGSTVDGRCDQYSVGVLLYEMSCGRPPFDSSQSLFRLMKSVSEGNFAPPSTHYQKCSKQLEAITLRAMAREAKDRFASMRELGQELLTIASERTKTTWGPVFEADEHANTQPSAISSPVARSPKATEQVADHTAASHSGSTLRAHDLPGPERSMSSEAAALPPSKQPSSLPAAVRPRPDASRHSVSWIGWVALAAAVVFFMADVILVKNLRVDEPESKKGFAPQASPRERESSGAPAQALSSEPAAQEARLSATTRALQPRAPTEERPGPAPPPIHSPVQSKASEQPRIPRPTQAKGEDEPKPPPGDMPSEPAAAPPPEKPKMRVNDNLNPWRK